MTAQQLAAMLTDAGLDQTTVNGLVNNAKFQQQAAALAQQQELDTINARQQTLQTSYDKSRQYEEWYNRNYDAILAQKEAVRVYQERYGVLDATQQQQQQTQQQQQQQQTQTGTALTKEQVKEIIANEMRTDYGAQVTRSIIGTGKIVEMHARNRRENPIDWAKIEELARARGGDVESAYQEWDKPEAIKAASAAEEARVKSKVDQEVERRMLAISTGQFPAGAGADYGSGSPSPLSQRTGSDVQPYDRNKVLQAANEVLHDPNFRPGWKQ